MRERLSPGTNITLRCDGAPRQFQIDAVIGDGASCIAYDAHRTDGNGASLRCRLKECYPFHAQIERSGVRLQWADEQEKQDAFQRLERSHRLVVKLCNDESVGNNITRAELCEGNGTLYSVMDVNHAKTYAFDSDQNLHSILDTMRVLTAVVGNLHAQGYLHLDIKPDNFLVSHRPSTSVWLFDVDSLTSMDDLKSGAVQTISYSQQWAAPEQLLGQTGKLCEATDLFAIGAVLFEKVMGRQVQNEDMGLFADWEFDGAMFDNVNPKVKRYLREIFRKTLAASVKRRYQSADELLATLENACDITIEGKPFLKSDCPVLTTQFVGRQQELLEIRDAFHSGKHAVFLHGVGGIGKSTLALAYGNQFQKEYDAVIFCRYRDSLEELFEDIEIQNFDGSTKDHSKHLRRLLDKNILLIIDNFDVEIDADDFLDDLMRLKCNTLFTSRTDFSTVYTGDVKQIEVNSLPYEKLEELFTSICGLKLGSEEERQTFYKLLKMVDSHTYFIELAAKQIVASGCSLDSLYTALRNGISGLDGKEKVRTQKDGRIAKRTIPEILRVLFQIADLSESRKQVLRNFYMLRFVHLDKAEYCRFTYEGAHGIDILNDLVELGWICQNGRYFTLHPLVEELVKTDLRPSEENCKSTYGYFKLRIQESIDFHGYEEAEEYAFAHNCELICLFLVSLDFSVPSNRQIAINWLKGLLDNEDTSLGDPEEWCFKKLYQKLLQSIESFEVSPQEIFDITCINLWAWAAQFDHFYVADDDTKQRMDGERISNFKKFFTASNEAAEALPEGQREHALDKVYSSVSCLLNNRNFTAFPDEEMFRLYYERPNAFEFDVYTKERLGLQLTDVEQKEIAEFYDSYPAFKADYTSPEIDIEVSCKEKFSNSNDKIAFVSNIASDNTLSMMERAKRIHHCLDTVFSRFHFQPFRSIQPIKCNWDMLEELLDIEEDVLISDDCTPEGREEHEEWSNFLMDNDINQAIVYAAKDDHFGFNLHIDGIFEDIQQDIERMLKHDGAWWRFMSFKGYFALPLWELNCGLATIDKSSWMVPCLLRYIDGWTEYLKAKEQFDEEAFFPLYKELVHTAELAATEDNLPKEEKRKFDDIAFTYQDKMDELTGVTYIIKPTED